MSTSEQVADAAGSVAALDALVRMPVLSATDLVVTRARRSPSRSCSPTASAITA